jgi:hypothetical protein
LDDAGVGLMTSPKNISWTNGFNRLFLVAAFVWAGYVFWYLPVSQWHEQHNVAYESRDNCQASSSLDQARFDECERILDKKIAELGQSAWSDYRLRDWLWLSEIYIFVTCVAYAVLRAVVFLVQWIRRGFSSAT